MQTANPYSTPVANVADAPSNDVGRINVLSFQGRIGRVRYIEYTFGLMLLLNFGSGLALVFAGAQMGMVIAFIVMAAVVVLCAMLTVQRAHDFNVSGWLAIIGFVPLLNFIFWLVPGTDGNNRFGPKTPPNTIFAVILACIIPVVMVVGIIAAIAIPAYHEHQYTDSSDESAQYEQIRSSE
ncbi:MAG: DUF805 domain-containing protein [Burkholderiales bacterium]|jgi:uncharacterized membrane protein YhaH (DUF805 family)